ncbi:MAG: type I restriction enzyme HsdR N-terminal domain-containing protein [Desulfobacterales bacterium]|nr:type I restriction enzyme HsdR N-terminal domain-containing protein [Desulfobacterales bacterium]
MKKIINNITDFVTGKEIPNVGSEENRQLFEKFLVEKKGFSNNDIEIDVPILLDIDGESYDSSVDIIVCINDIKLIAVKCAAGSIGSREREILSAARIFCDYQIPFSVVTDGKTAIIMDTISGKKIGDSIEAVHSKPVLIEILNDLKLVPLSKERINKEKIIFRSYDSMNVNRIKNLL